MISLIFVVNFNYGRGDLVCYWKANCPEVGTQVGCYGQAQAYEMNLRSSSLEHFPLRVLMPIQLSSHFEIIIVDMTENNEETQSNSSVDFIIQQLMEQANSLLEACETPFRLNTAKTQVILSVLVEVAKHYRRSRDQLKKQLKYDQEARRKLKETLREYERRCNELEKHIDNAKREEEKLKSKLTIENSKFESQGHEIQNLKKQVKNRENQAYRYRRKAQQLEIKIIHQNKKGESKEKKNPSFVLYQNAEWKSISEMSQPTPINPLNQYAEDITCFFKQLYCQLSELVPNQQKLNPQVFNITSYEHLSKKAIPALNELLSEVKNLSRGKTSPQLNKIPTPLSSIQGLIQKVQQLGIWRQKIRTVEEWSSSPENLYVVHQSIALLHQLNQKQDSVRDQYSTLNELPSTEVLDKLREKVETFLKQFDRKAAQNVNQARWFEQFMNKYERERADHND